MSTQALLDLIRQRFSATEGKTILESLTQDPLVWQYVQNAEESLPYFESAPKEISAFSPGRIALLQIEQVMGCDLHNVKNLSQKLPNSIRHLAAKTYQTLINTGLPPLDLLNAGLLALTLRERRVIEGSWKGISKEIIKNPTPSMTWKYFLTWRTPFACLMAYCPDFDEAVADFNRQQSPIFSKAVIPLFLHARLSNPMLREQIMNQLFTFTKVLPIDGQLTSLQWLEQFEQTDLQKTLAGHLLQIRSNQSFFAETFSEVEAVETTAENGDPLEKSIPYSLPKKLNQLAAFHYHSGDHEKSVEVFQKSCDLIGLLQSQIRFQALALQGVNASPSGWNKMVQDLPNSQKAHLLHIRSLIDHKSIDEARDLLKNLPANSEKRLMEVLGGLQPETQIETNDKTQQLIEGTAIVNSLPASASFVRNPNTKTTSEWVGIIENIHDQKQRLSIIDRLLQSRNKDHAFLAFARDVIEQAGHHNRALEIAALLERLEPDALEHQRALARLYAKTSRWQKAFSLLQILIRETTDPEPKDLASFAESALMTQRVDMAISICQNILSHDKENVEALILLGKAFMEKGDIVKAIQHMEQVVALIPEDPQTWIHLARFWENSGQTDRAFEILRQGILAVPDDPELLLEIGQAHLEKGSPTEARVNLRKAFEIDHSNTPVRLHLAKAEFQLGNNSESLSLLEPISEDYEKNPYLASLFGAVLLSLGKGEEALPVLLSAAKHNPSDLDAVLKVADLILEPSSMGLNQFHDDEFEALEKVLEPALLEYPEDAQLILRIADLNRARGHYQEAHQSYAQLAMVNHDQKALPDWRVQYGLGLTSTALGDVEIGLAALQDAAQSQPNSLPILHALATAYTNADLQDKALESAKSALKLAPREIENLIWYAHFNAENNHLDEALHALQEARQLDPERLGLILLQAKTLNAKNKAEEAIEHLDELLAKEEATAALLHQSAYLYIQLQELDRAVIAMEKAHYRNEESSPLLVMDLAFLYSLIGQKKKALEIIDLPDENFQQSPPLAMLKGVLLSQMGQYGSALKALDLINNKSEMALQELDPESRYYSQSPLLFRLDFTYKGFLIQRGQLLQATGDPKKAQQVLEVALNIAPEDHSIQNALVNACVALLDFERALEISKCQNPLDTNPAELDLDQLDLVCTLTEILWDRNNDEMVEEILNHPALMEREYPRALALKSRLAVKNGLYPQARETLNHALDAYQENLRETNPSTPSECFRLQANLQTLALASMELEDYPTAHQVQHEAWKLLKNQPYQNFHYLRLITQTAEKQQVARAAKVTGHAPGTEYLDDHYYQLGKGLIDSLEKYLPMEGIRCLRARLSSGFSGKWPAHLLVDKCLNSPDNAAAFILGCVDEVKVREVVNAFPGELLVMQTSTIFTLRTGLGDGKTAVENALAIEPANPINHALLGLVNIQDLELAVKSFETAVQIWPEESEWHKILSELYDKLGNSEAASRHITLAIENNPTDSAYWQTRAGYHLKLNQLDQAKLDLERSTQLHAQNADVWVQMSDVNRRLGNISEAGENIHTAASIKPEDHEIAIRQIEYLLDQGQYQEAAAKASQKIEKDGSHPQYQILLARSRAKMGDFDAALEPLQAGKDRSSANPEMALESLKIKSSRDGIEKILPDLIRLAGEQPEHTEILTTLTDWLIQTNRLKEAQETAQTILRIIPDSAEVHLRLGRLQRIRGQLDQAIAHLSDAIANDPNLIEAYIELGKTYQKRRNLEEAIRVFQMGSKIDASDPRPYYHVAMALKTRKDYSGAEAMLKRAKKYAPGDASILRQLGVITALNLINNLRETRVS